MANVRSGRKIHRVYWTTPEEELNAKPYLEILVESILSATDVFNDDKMWMISSRIPDALHKALHLYKIDSGLKNLDQALLLCLSETLKNKGYLNGHDSKISSSGQAGTKITKTPLW